MGSKIRSFDFHDRNELLIRGISAKIGSTDFGPNEFKPNNPGACGRTG